MAKVRLVVVLVSPKMLTQRATGTHAARILPLGLTAYGKTRDEAMSKVKRMLVSAVAAHRELGTLELWLEHSGLNWFWEDEYKGALPVEYPDTSPSPEGKSPTVSRRIRDSWQNIEEPQFVAA